MSTLYYLFQKKQGPSYINAALDAMVISDDWAEEELERQLRALSPIHCIEDAEKKLKELESNENLKNGK